MYNDNPTIIQLWFCVLTKPMFTCANISELLEEVLQYLTHTKSNNIHLRELTMAPLLTY